MNLPADMTPSLTTTDNMYYVMNLRYAAVLGLRTLTLASAAFIASVLYCGFRAARTALAQIAEKRM